MIVERTLYEYVGGGGGLSDVGGSTDRVLTLIVNTDLVNNQPVNATVRAGFQLHVVTGNHFHASV